MEGDEGDVKETSGWHLSSNGRGQGDRRGCHGEQFGPVITDKQGGSGGREGEGQGRRGGAQRKEPYNLGGTAPCLLV